MAQFFTLFPMNGALVVWDSLCRLEGNFLPAGLPRKKWFDYCWAHFNTLAYYCFRGVPKLYYSQYCRVFIEQVVQQVTAADVRKASCVSAIPLRLRQLGTLSICSG